jgi:hypothetical protein
LNHYYDEDGCDGDKLSGGITKPEKSKQQSGWPGVFMFWHRSRSLTSPGKVGVEERQYGYGEGLRDRLVGWEKSLSRRVADQTLCMS